MHVGFRVQDLGFRVSGFTVGALGLVFFGFRVYGVGEVRVFELSCPVGSHLTNFTQSRITSNRLTLEKP